MKKLYTLFVLVLTLGSTLSYASSEALEHVDSRGLEQKFVLTKPEGKPVASVILLAGGHGKLDLSSFLGSVNFGWGAKNNLVRTRELYANQGYLVATMDAPSNRNRMNAIWRMSEEHAEDINAVAKYLKAKSDVPVWVIGTSMGSFSAANAGIRLNNSIDGIVLTSSVTQSKSKWKIYREFPNGIINMDLVKATKPVLVISHKNDECALTPASDINTLASKFTSSSKVEVEVFTGGDSPISDPCEALSAHGFLGIEDKVVERISAFINSN